MGDRALLVPDASAPADARAAALGVPLFGGPGVGGASSAGSAGGAGGADADAPVGKTMHRRVSELEGRVAGLRRQQAGLAESASLSAASVQGDAVSEAGAHAGRLVEGASTALRRDVPCRQDQPIRVHADTAAYFVLSAKVRADIVH